MTKIKEVTEYFIKTSNSVKSHKIDDIELACHLIIGKTLVSMTKIKEVTECFIKTSNFVKLHKIDNIGLACHVIIGKTLTRSIRL